ncbi:methylcobalamin:coenzyme M methyltransferase [Oxobacter pfennigii]|uniref:Methylcobalamin:coenzyme M methyltransferase n=1 Tax=Oxobacter pfennigii TaxID=36849 RepID=A0A0N8NTS4_9CLOT|nr:uroporphyrinogen decarboxylase family protein [Oxobacter pfennigii]KPU45640.1 methylcobalamin:coenzyme M methyltransferase [Oxobacter pfennigii]
MSEDVKKLYNERLGRYTAAIALEPTDRVPLAFNSNYFAEKDSGYTYQQIMYDPQIWAQLEVDFAKKHPELDTVRTNIQFSPNYDVVNTKLYKVPGRDIDPNSLQQFVEGEYMKADEYRMFIDDPIGFRMDRYFPRVLGEYKDRGSTRSYMAFLKSGFLQGIAAGLTREREGRLQNEVGMPVPVRGGFTAPFDVLSDNFRGLNGIMRDMFRQPDDVLEACEAILKDQLARAVSSADPKKQLPIFIATHKPCFMSPKQFDKFYWPTFYKGVMTLIEAGWKFRIFLEGNWEPHWHHMAEFPKGTVLCDVDNEADIFKAKETFGHKQCITGGIPTHMLILGTPEEIKARVKLLCETVGKDGGWIPQGGGHIPQDTKPENFRALIDAVIEYGKYSDGPAPEPKVGTPGTNGVEFPAPGIVTPWDVIKAENDWIIPGDEELIKHWWERLDRMAYSWVMTRS